MDIMRNGNTEGRFSPFDDDSQPNLSRPDHPRDAAKVNQDLSLIDVDEDSYEPVDFVRK